MNSEAAVPLFGRFVSSGFQGELDKFDLVNAHLGFSLSLVASHSFYRRGRQFFVLLDAFRRKTGISSM